MYFRLSGILHVLFEALQIFIVPYQEIPVVPKTVISQEEVQMAMALTEYFQAQRQAYDKVGTITNLAGCFPVSNYSYISVYASS